MEKKIKIGLIIIFAVILLGLLFIYANSTLKYPGDRCVKDKECGNCPMDFRVSCKNGFCNCEYTRILKPNIPANCEKVEVFGGGGDIADICSLPEDKKKNTCFRQFERGIQSIPEYRKYNISKCTLLDTQCRRSENVLGTEMYCYFSCCK